MLDAQINDIELLFRAVKKFPNWWNIETNKPTSAVFKDSRGVSVDRQEVRSIEDSVESIKQKFDLKAIISVTAEQCRGVGVFPKYDGQEDNIYHSLILESADVIEIKPSNAKKLSRISEIQFLAAD